MEVPGDVDPRVNGPGKALGHRPLDPHVQDGAGVPRGGGTPSQPSDLPPRPSKWPRCEVLEGGDVAPGEARDGNGPVRTQNDPIPERAQEDCVVAGASTRACRRTYKQKILKGDKKEEAKLVLRNK